MRTLFTSLALLAGAAATPAQETRFRFAPGERFATEVEQATTVTETRAAVGDKPAEVRTSSAKVSLTRQWAVRAVDAAGVATLDLSLGAMRQVIAPSARAGERVEAVTIDSATPEGRAALKGVLDRVVLTVRLQPSGRLVSAEAQGGAPTGRIDAELPLRVVWPATPVVPGATWVRAAKLTLDPPSGTGEVLELTQTYTFNGVRDGLWVVGVSTTPKVEPADGPARMAVATVAWEGEIDFDPALGRYAGCRLKVAREVEGFAGPGTKFRYESTLTETRAK